jgi:hypothetical protein
MWMSFAAVKSPFLKTTASRARDVIYLAVVPPELLQFTCLLLSHRHFRPQRASSKQNAMRKNNTQSIIAQ